MMNLFRKGKSEEHLLLEEKYKKLELDYARLRAINNRNYEEIQETRRLLAGYKRAIRSWEDKFKKLKETEVKYK